MNGLGGRQRKQRRRDLVGRRFGNALETCSVGTGVGCQ